MVQIECQIEADIKAYAAARRAMLELWTAKRQLSQIAQARFPHSHPLFKSLVGLCHNDATCQIRHLCDVAICTCADLVGDDLFRDRIVDDVCIPAVTHWYYGISHPSVTNTEAPNWTKILTRSDIELFEHVYHLGRRFVDCASVLPFLPTTKFVRERSRFEKTFKKAREKLERSCLLYFAYSELQTKLPQSITDDIAALCSE